MKFSDLNLFNGMVAKRRNGSMITIFSTLDNEWRYVSINNVGKFYIVYNREGESLDHGLDIMAVYKPTKFDGNTIDFGNPIWERPIDWSAVKVNTPVLVSSDGNGWMKRHFSLLVDGVVYTFDDGTTSWTSCGRRSTWKYTKLAE